MKPRRSYFICCVPRTGSWLLSESLQSAALAGKPREYFAPEAYHNFIRRWKLPPNSGFPEFLARLETEAATPNGIWGAKVHWYQFEDLLAKLRTLPGLSTLPLPALIPVAFANPQYIYLTRRDRARHAVSYARASETKVWWDIASGTENGRMLLTRTPRLDESKLDRMLRIIKDHNRAWRKYFAACGVTPLRVYYEDLAKDPTTEVRRILDFLNIPFSPDLHIPTSRLRKQSDDLSELWVKRYRRTLQARRSGETG
jgi:trehalose 2-sulfotransferase